MGDETGPGPGNLETPIHDQIGMGALSSFYISKSDLLSLINSKEKLC